MRTEKFLKRLKKGLPLWLEKGRVDDENREAIIDHVASGTDSAPKHLTLASSISTTQIY